MLIPVSALTSTLYEEFGRIKVAKGILLVGLALVLSDLVDTVSAELNPHITILLSITTASLLFYTGVHAQRKFSMLINEVLLKTTLCIYTGEECEELVGKTGDPVEVALNRAMELLRGEWSPLEEVLRMIRSPERSMRRTLSLVFILLYISMYHVLISFSLSFLLSVLLVALGAVESARPVAKIPFYVVGFILILFGFMLSYSTRLTLELDEVKIEQSSHEATSFIPVEALYRRMLTVVPRNRFERIVLELTLLFFNAIPNYLKPRLEAPLAVINLYECSPVLSTIINEVMKLGERSFDVEIKGDQEWMKEECNKIGGLEKFITLHDKKSPADIHKELMLIGKKEEDMKHATKIIIRETERLEEWYEVVSGGKRAYLSGKSESKPGKAITVVGLRAWKGCTIRYRIKPKTSSRKRNQAKTTMEPRRVISVFIVGRKDIASIINTLISAYLRRASVENILCVDQEETQPATDLYREA